MITAYKSYMRRALRTSSSKSSSSGNRLGISALRNSAETMETNNNPFFDFFSGSSQQRELSEEMRRALSREKH